MYLSKYAKIIQGLYSKLIIREIIFNDFNDAFHLNPSKPDVIQN